MGIVAMYGAKFIPLITIEALSCAIVIVPGNEMTAFPVSSKNAVYGSPSKNHIEARAFFMDDVPADAVMENLVSPRYMEALCEAVISCGTYRHIASDGSPMAVYTWE